MSFSIEQIELGFHQFLAISNGAGPLDPIQGAAADFQGFPVPNRPSSSQQIGYGIWFVHAVTDDGSPNSQAHFEAFVADVLPDQMPGPGPNDLEIRFSGTSSYAYDLQTAQLVEVPFSVWNTGVGTPLDSSDDYQYVIAIDDHDADGFNVRWLDHPASGSDNDPFTDQFMIFDPVNTAEGSVGYDEWLGSSQAGGEVSSHGPAILKNLTLINWNGGAVSAASSREDFLVNVVDQLVPEPGTIFRIETTKLSPTETSSESIRRSLHRH